MGNEVKRLARDQRSGHDLVVLAFTKSEMGIYWKILK